MIKGTFELRVELDNYGRRWPGFLLHERCMECGQPDSWEDCNHEKLSEEEVKELGGEL